MVVTSVNRARLVARLHPTARIGGEDVYENLVHGLSFLTKNSIGTAKSWIIIQFTVFGQLYPDLRDLLKTHVAENPTLRIYLVIIIIVVSIILKSRVRPLEVLDFMMYYIS